MSAASSIPNTTLEHFYANLPHKPYCGSDKCANLIRPKRAATRYPYIQVNPPQMLHWMVFDLDHSNSLIWDDVGAPAPNFTVRNRATGRAHLYYAIEPVCTSKAAKERPQRFWRAVYRGLARELDADPQYTGRIAKNPLAASWATHHLHSHVYSLHDIAREVEPIANDPIASRMPIDTDDDEKGRNCRLFNHLRQWAYSQVHRYRNAHTEEQWHQDVFDRAIKLVPPEPDFSINEIRNTAKSVAKWTWMHYHGRQKNKTEIAQLNITTTEKQALSAKRTHSLRKKGSSEAIRRAVTALKRQGKGVTYTALSAITGLSRQHISRHYSHLCAYRPLDIRELLEQKHVNYGVHQVTACFVGSGSNVLPGSVWSLFELAANDMWWDSS